MAYTVIRFHQNLMLWVILLSTLFQNTPTSGRASALSTGLELRLRSRDRNGHIRDSITLRAFAISCFLTRIIFRRHFIIRTEHTLRLGRDPGFIHGNPFRVSGGTRHDKGGYKVGRFALRAAAPICIDRNKERGGGRGGGERERGMRGSKG